MASKILFSCILKVNKLIAKILDFCAFPRIVEMLWQRIKLNTRKLTLLEEQEARKVFGDSINYSKVRIDESSLISWLGARINKCSCMGVTTFYTINFNRKIKTAIGNSDMKWLIHELTHVAQMEHAGSKYFIEAIYAQKTMGYKYVLGEKKRLKHYNREQQASIIADFYSMFHSGKSTQAFEGYIAELKAGRL
ncbi:MAG: hypothetical protein ACPK85_06560 [Methanosarcina sp.]